MTKHEQVTKVKNEGRVAAGKRLVEWNRKNKENLVKNREQVASSDFPSAPREPQSQASTVVYGGGALAILVGVGFALYLLSREKKPLPAAHSLESSNDEIFCMN